MRADFSTPIGRSALLSPPREISDGELNDVLGAHRLWLESRGVAGKRANIINRVLVERDLSGALLARARLELCDMRRVVLEKANLADTTFLGSDLGQANLAGCQGQGAIFLSVHCEQASFQGAVLDKACFMLAHLNRADFTDGSLRQTDFQDAELTDACFHRAALHGTEVARWYLGPEHFTGASGNAKTKVPKSVEPLLMKTDK